MPKRQYRIKTRKLQCAQQKGHKNPKHVNSIYKVGLPSDLVQMLGWEKRDEIEIHKQGNDILLQRIED